LWSSEETGEAGQRGQLDDQVADRLQQVVATVTPPGEQVLGAGGRRTWRRRSPGLSGLRQRGFSGSFSTVSACRASGKENLYICPDLGDWVERINPVTVRQ
jgi:hypothetical protein